MAGGALGQLSIKMSADVGQAISDIGKFATETNRRLQSISRGISTLTGGFLALGGAAGIGMFIKSGIGAMATLDDMAERTGATVEKLSELSAIAQVGGHSIETVEMGMIKLAKALGGVDEKSTAASNALKSIGLNALDIRTLDPGDAMKVIAKRLDEFKDGMGKTAFLMAVFGKSGAQLAPFLKDLAEQTERLRIITAEEAAESERLEKNWKRLELQAGELKKSIVISLLPSLNDIAQAMVDARKAGEGFWSTMFEGAKAATQALMGWNAAGDLKAKTEEIKQAYQTLKEMQAERFGPNQLPMDPAMINQMKDRIAALVVERTRMLDQIAAVKGLQPDKIKKPDVPFAVSDAAAKAEADMRKRWREIDNASWVKHIEVMTAEYEDELREMAKIYDKSNSERDKARQDSMMAYFKIIDDEQDAAIEQGRVLLEASKNTSDEMTEFWKSAAQNMQSAMSSFFFDVMQGNLSDLAGSFKRTIDRMVADMLAAKAATALFGAEFGKGGAIGGIIGTIASTVFGPMTQAPAPVVEGAFSFATGTDFVPRTGLAVLHQGEAVIPASENALGRGVTINMIINTPDANSFRASRSQIIADMSMALAGARRNL